MRNVNLAHGSLYLLGAYVGWIVAEQTGLWVLGVAAGFLSAAVVGLLMQVFIFRFMEGQDLRQTLVTIGVDLSEMATVGDLQGGIEEAERLLGYKVLPLADAVTQS
jgi:branched-subunit amino acid ABC-type transport system permease component